MQNVGGERAERRERASRAMSRPKPPEPTRSRRKLKNNKRQFGVFIDSLFLNALPVPMLATGFFEGQNGAKTLQDAPRRAKMRQDAPKRAPRRPKTPPRRPKMPPRGAKTPQDSENRPKLETSWHQNRCKWKVIFENLQISQIVLSLQRGLDFRRFGV